MYNPIARAWLCASCMIATEFSNGASKHKGNGTGFWVKDLNEDVVLVTNRHVFDPPFKDSKYAHSGYSLTYFTMTSFDDLGNQYRMQVEPAKILRALDDTFDIALIRRRDCRVISGDPNVIAPADQDVLADAPFLNEELEWGAQVTFASYQPWRDQSSDRPILRSGIVSSDPRQPYEHKDISVQSLLLLEAFSFEGSSGSPVFANAYGIQLGPGLSGGRFRPAKIIGIIAGHLKNTGDGDTSVVDKLHTGLSYVHRSDQILELINGSEADLKVI